MLREYEGVLAELQAGESLQSTLHGRPQTVCEAALHESTAACAAQHRDWLQTPQQHEGEPPHRQHAVSIRRAAPTPLLTHLLTIARPECQTCSSQQATGPNSRHVPGACGGSTLSRSQPPPVYAHLRPPVPPWPQLRQDVCAGCAAGSRLPQALGASPASTDCRALAAAGVVPPLASAVVPAATHCRALAAVVPSAAACRGLAAAVVPAAAA